MSWSWLQSASKKSCQVTAAKDTKRIEVENDSLGLFNRNPGDSISSLVILKVLRRLGSC